MCITETFSAYPQLIIHISNVLVEEGIIIELNVKVFFVLIFNSLCMSTFAKHPLKKELVLRQALRD